MLNGETNKELPYLASWVQEVSSMMLIQFLSVITSKYYTFLSVQMLHECKCKFVFCVIVCNLCLCKSYTCTCVHMQVEPGMPFGSVYTYTDSYIAVVTSYDKN